MKKEAWGETGEAYLINKDAYAISPLKDFPNGVLTQIVGSQAAIKALSGEMGIVEQLDYQGHKVLAAYAPIPKTQWGFVVKQNTSEIFPNLEQAYIKYLVLFIVLCMVVILAANFLGRSILAPISKIMRVSEAIENGNLSARVKGVPANEFGKLSRSFNRMAMEISSNFEVWENVIDISKTIMGVSEAEEFGKKIIA